jgi:hypothetical protein
MSTTSRPIPENMSILDSMLDNPPPLLLVVLLAVAVAVAVLRTSDPVLPTLYP